MDIVTAIFEILFIKHSNHSDSIEIPLRKILRSVDVFESTGSLKKLKSTVSINIDKEDKYDLSKKIPEFTFKYDDKIINKENQSSKHELQNVNCSLNLCFKSIYDAFFPDKQNVVFENPNTYSFLI